MSGNQFIEPELPKEEEIPLEIHGAESQEPEDVAHDASAEEEKTEETPKAPKVKPVRVAKRSAFWGLLSGEFLTRRAFLKQLPLIFLIFFYAVIYISVSRMVDSNIKEINTLKNNLKSYRNQHIYLKSEMMKKCKQTQIERDLDTLGVKVSTTPVIILYNSTKEEK